MFEVMNYIKNLNGQDTSIKLFGEQLSSAKAIPVFQRTGFVKLYSYKLLI